MDVVRRGWVASDRTEFGEGHRANMQAAAQEITYLLNRKYDIKSVVVFVGNHYQLTERQRMALTRMLTSYRKAEERKKKEQMFKTGVDAVYVDGFNTIITLEVALSNSLLLRSVDGTLRDLAGLRGTYRIVDKTKRAVTLMLNGLQSINPKETVIYLDQPVSNSGRLKGLIHEMAENIKLNVQVEVIPDVDRRLYGLEWVITSDAIILDHCQSWYNLNARLVETHILDAWIYELNTCYI